MSTPYYSNRVIKQVPPQSGPFFNNVVSHSQQQQQQRRNPSVRIQQQQQWEQQVMKFTSDLTSLSSCICAFKNSFAHLHKNLDQIHNSIFSLVNNLQQQQQQQLLRHHPMPQAYPQIQSTNISTDNVTTTAEAGPPSPPPPHLQTNTQTQSLSISTDDVSTTAEPEQDKKPPPLPRLPQSNTETLSAAENVSATTDEPKKPPAQMESGPGMEATDPAEPGPEPEYCPAVNPWRPSIEHLCRSMLGAEVREYITRNLLEGDPNVVREDVVASLKLAPNPSQLVFECVGYWFMKLPKNRCEDRHKATRVLILEYFLLMMGGCIPDGIDIELEPTLKRKTMQGAVMWRSRMIREGGLGEASEIDARGLLLFLACFGIPSIFTHQDLATLVRLSNIKEILKALKCSRLLPPRLPGIIKVMAKNGSYAEVIELARSFGIEDKCSPQAILTTFLQETRKRLFSSPAKLKESKRNLLAALKSLVKFVENQGQDLEKICDGWKLKEEIVNLEKEISQITNNLGDPDSIGDGKMMQKRKLDEVSCSSSIVMREELKRSCVAVRDPPLPTSPSVNNGLNEQKPGVITLDDDPLRSLPCKDAFHSCHLNNDASASVVSHTYAGPGVVGYPAGVVGLEARDAAGSFNARPSLRPSQPLPHGEISVLGNDVM